MNIMANEEKDKHSSYVCTAVQAITRIDEPLVAKKRTIIKKYI